ncbi:hypothetical protein [Companilactobacillus sp. DQM5]
MMIVILIARLVQVVYALILVNITLFFNIFLTEQRDFSTKKKA